MNGQATKIACENILSRLRAVAGGKLQTEQWDAIEIKDEIVHFRGRKTDIGWNELITLAYFARVNLSAQAHYATPNIYFDRKIEKGSPFAYHVYGTGIVEVTLDCLRGTYQIDAVKIVHDCGTSLNELVDRGQVEGAVVQGLGWVTIEELLHDQSGRLLTDTLTTYKVPDIYFAPAEIQVHFLENADNRPGLLNSKAIGEPPLMYGIGAYFALVKAIKAFRADAPIPFSAPLTPEKVLLALHGESQDLNGQKGEDVFR